MSARDASGPRPEYARWALSALQLLATLALLAWALTRVDRALFTREKLAFGWLAAALACTAPAFAAAALRWSFTARRLGVPLPFRRALSEVYLASFLNCVLPTGMAGDVLRATRQVGQRTRALLSVALERLSGQVVLWLVLLGSLASWPGIARALPWCLPLLLLSAAIAIAWRARTLRAVEERASGGEQDSAAELNASDAWKPASSQPAEAESRLWPAVKRALFAEGALAVQLVSSALVLAACTLGFACTAKGLSVPLSFSDLTRIVPPLLALSALPVSIGGFGLREAASAALYAQDGLDPATGIAVASTFGCLNLLGSAPGALLAYLRPALARATPRAATWARVRAARCDERSATEPESDDAFTARAQTASFVLALLLLGALASSLALGQLIPLAFAGPLGLAQLVLQLRSYGSSKSVLPNLITALRVVLIGSMALGVWGSAPLPYALLVLTVFTLDGVDGALARRWGANSRLGAHFDMESDGYLVLVLCALLYLRGSGSWVLIGGLLRYAYVIMTRLIPSRGEAPPSRFGRYAFAASLTALTLALLPQPPVARALSLLGTGVLVWSFGRSFYWAFRGAPAAATRA